MEGVTVLEGDGVAERDPVPEDDGLPEADGLPANDDIPVLDGVVMRVRPLGISVLAVLAAIGCVVGILVTVAATGGAGVVTGGALALVVVPLILVVSGVLAFGLWELRWWAWPLALLSWISAGVQAIVAATHGTFSTDLLVAPTVIAYLAQHDIRSVFGPRILTPSRRLAAVTAALALVVAVLPVGSAAVAGWSPAVPGDAGSTLVAQVDVARLLSTGVGTVPTSDGEEDAFRDHECLDRDQRAAGWLDLCWVVDQIPDEDPVGDYYRFEAYGTFGSAATEPGQAEGSGVRWLVLRSRLQTPVVDGWSFGEPNGETVGCLPGRSGLLSGERAVELPCDGRTVGVAELQAQTVTWTCLGCLIPESFDRGIGISTEVKVAQGAKPAWTLYADFGS